MGLFLQLLDYCFLTDTLLVFVFNTFNKRYIAAQKELNNKICTLQETINSNDVYIKNMKAQSTSLIDKIVYFIS